MSHVSSLVRGTYSAGGGGGGTVTGTGFPGEIAFWTTPDNISGNSTFVYTGSAVGLGTSTPTTNFDVLGSSSYGVIKIIGNGVNAESTVGYRSSNVSDGGAGDWVVGVNGSGNPIGSFGFYESSFGSSIITISPGTGFVTAASNVSVTGHLVTTAGSTIASANDIILPNSGNAFTLIGTTQVNTISFTDTAGFVFPAGFEVTLMYNDVGTLTIAHNTAGTGAVIFLAGSLGFTMSANSILKLISDGTQWQEVSRKSP